MWHRLLLFLRIRNEYDWAFPAWPEVNHPYMPHATLRCCEHCGGGQKNWIHRKPYDTRRAAEILSAHSTVFEPSKRHGYTDEQCHPEL